MAVPRTHGSSWRPPARRTNSRLIALVAGAGLVMAGCTSTPASVSPPTVVPVVSGTSPQTSSTMNSPQAVSAGAVTAQSMSTSPSTGAPASSGALAVDPQAAGLQDQYETVIRTVLPSIVQITTSVGLGSGVVYDTKGDIVTNDHVVGSATTFQVQLANSPHPVTATLVASYPTDDLAVIRLSSPAGVKPAVFGRSSQLHVGQIVLAMGNPLGLTSSVTNGIVSALGRTLTEPTSADSPGATLPNSIQTSASINPGNSGGALVDLQGQVIGIPTLAATDAQIGGAAGGIGFAIPSDTVRSIADQLIATGKVTNSGRAALGIRVQGITDNQGNDVGVAIAAVEAGKAAAKAGLKAGDIITELDGRPITSTSELASLLAGLPIGKIVPVVVVREGSHLTIRVTLGEL